MLTPGQTVKFLRNSRYSWEYKKGDLGFVTRILSRSPAANIDIIIIRHIKSDSPMWVTEKDVTQWEQLELF